MRFPKRQSDAEPAQDQDPLSPYSAPTVRRQTDRGGTQPLDDGSGGPPRNSDTQVGADFATRQLQRRMRQGSAGGYQQRFGEMARKVDNRQITMLFIGLILLLLALLAFRAWRQRGDEGTAGIDTQDRPAATFEPEAGATAELGLEPPPVGAIVTVGPLDNANPPATDNGQAPAPAGGATFVVAGTQTEGLFLRSAPGADPPLATLPEGTQVQDLGEEQNDGTRTWKKIRTDQGEGWVAADFLVPAP